MAVGGWIGRWHWQAGDGSKAIEKSSGVKFRESRAQWLIQGRVVCRFLILWMPCGLGLGDGRSRVCRSSVYT